MRFGYPKRIDLQNLVNACKPIEEKLKSACSKECLKEQPNYVYTKVLLFIGFYLKDFKMGNDLIFFRTDKIHLMEVFFSNLSTTSKQDSREDVVESHPISDSLTLKQKQKPK